VAFNANDGGASLSVFNLDVPDYIDFPNSMRNGTSIPAKVSFVCNWSSGGGQFARNNAEAGFAGNFFHNRATLSWTAQNEDGFSFVADPFSEGFALTGTTRNGRYFS
jgi:hypothetical protein